MEDFELNLDDILDDNEASALIGDQADEKEGDNEEESETSEVKEEEEEPAQKEEEEPESEQEETEDADRGESESQKSLYSSLAKALADEGIFSDVEDEEVDSIKSVDDFKAMFQKQINKGISDTNQMILDALNANVPKDEMNNLIGAINQLNNISDEALKDESEAGDRLRANIIANDLKQRGYSQDRIQRTIKQIFNSGSDIEDAVDALAALKETYANKYNAAIEEGKKKEAERVKALEKQQEDLKNSILNDKDLLLGLEIDKNTRQKVVENILKPSVVDKKTGAKLTAIQQYEKDNPEDFRKAVGVLFTITDGFKNINKVFKTATKKEMRKGFADLERKLNTTSLNSDGSLKMVSGVNDDPNSYFGKGFDFDL